MRSPALALMALFAINPVASAADWAREMFTTTQHDFGAVARASKTDYRFTFENRYSQPVHVRSVRTSCNCTTPVIETETVQPGEIGSILARFNTHSHIGKRQATITVSFDRPQFTEVQLTVRGYIRTDVVFSPGEADFGSIPEGENKSIAVNIAYAGRNDWAIVEVGEPHDYVKTELEEVSRGAGRVNYKLIVGISGNAPAGALVSELTLLTNDRNLKSVPLRLIANVESPLSVAPQLLAMGEVKPGEEIKKVLIVKGKKEFNVTHIEADGFAVRFDPTKKAKRMHSIPIVISAENGATDSDGDMSGKIQITTDLPGETKVFTEASCRIKKSES